MENLPFPNNNRADQSPLHLIRNLCFVFRLAYSVHHLESHLNESGEQEVIAMYDIACMLHKHLMVCIEFLFHS